MIRGHTPRRNRIETVLVVTPSLKYGSWGWFEDIIRHSQDISWVVVGYGRKPPNAPANCSFIAVPAGNYLKFGRLASRPWLLWLNFLYVLPLAVVAAIITWRYRPIGIMGNGIAVTVLLRICRLGEKHVHIWLAYHSAIGHLGSWLQRTMRALLRPVSGAFCNSASNVDELSSVLPGREVVHVPHWADDIFFSKPVEDRPLARPLQILYVGRTDREKFGQCKRVCFALAERGLAELTVIGPRAAGVPPAGVNYLGYVSSREVLRQWYERADLTWAPADIDYLSRPGVEALASGCPVVVSDIPAVLGKSSGRLRIPRALVPEGAGIVVNGTDDREVISLFQAWINGESSPGSRTACRSLAATHHSTENIRLITDVLLTA